MNLTGNLRVKASRWISFGHLKFYSARRTKRGWIRAVHVERVEQDLCCPAKSLGDSIANMVDY